MIYYVERKTIFKLKAKNKQDAIDLANTFGCDTYGEIIDVIFQTKVLNNIYNEEYWQKLKELLKKGGKNIK